MIEKIPVFSIVMPLYQMSEDLEESVLSVINQSFQSWELLIVENGSDNLEKEQPSFLNDPRIKTFHLPDPSKAEARNFATLKSTGRYITFLDADDSWEESYLQSLDSTFQNSPNSVIAVGVRVNIGSDSYYIPIDKGFRGNKLKWAIQRGNIAFAVERNSFDGLEFASEYFEDKLVLAQLMASHDLVLIDKPLYIYNCKRSKSYDSEKLGSIYSEGLKQLENIYDKLPEKLKNRYDISRAKFRILQAGIYQALSLKHLGLAHSFLKSTDYKPTTPSDFLRYLKTWIDYYKIISFKGQGHLNQS